MTRYPKTMPFLLLCLLLANTGMAAAPKPESAGQLAIKKAQGVVRQLTEEKQALATENASLQEQIKKLEAIAKQIEPLQAELLLHKNQEEALRAANSGITAQLQGEREKQQSLHHKIKDIVAQAKEIQNDNQLLVNAVNEREQWIKQCSDKNRRLLETNQALLEKYQQKGFWAKAAELEPFTGIAKVETQNTSETYQFKLEDLKVTDFAAAHPVRLEANANKNVADTATGNPQE